jgi:hypothetical protein
MGTIDEIRKMARVYADTHGTVHPTGQDYMAAAVACGERPEMIRATAEIAATCDLNAEANAPRLPIAPETLTDRAACAGKCGHKALRLMASGRYTGREVLSIESGRWELPHA